MDGSTSREKPGAKVTPPLAVAALAGDGAVPKHPSKAELVPATSSSQLSCDKVRRQDRSSVCPGR